MNDIQVIPESETSTWQTLWCSQTVAIKGHYIYLFIIELVNHTYNHTCTYIHTGSRHPLSAFWMLETVLDAGG